VYGVNIGRQGVARGPFAGDRIALSVATLHRHSSARGSPAHVAGL